MSFLQRVNIAWNSDQLTALSQSSSTSQMISSISACAEMNKSMEPSLTAAKQQTDFALGQNLFAFVVERFEHASELFRVNFPITAWRTAVR